VFDRSVVRARLVIESRIKNLVAAHMEHAKNWEDRSVRGEVQADIRTHLIHRPARDIIPPLGGAEFSFLSRLILRGSHTAVASRAHWNLVPSTQMRCMITANRRASATIAFFIPRCLAIFIAQALSQDHFAKRTNMI
jgi:hypothetical protein